LRVLHSEFKHKRIQVVNRGKNHPTGAKREGRARLNGKHFTAQILRQTHLD
jgi:hypothetical protein